LSELINVRSLAGSYGYDATRMLVGTVVALWPVRVKSQDVEDVTEINNIACTG